MSDIESLVAAGVEKRIETIRTLDRDFAETQRRKLLAIVRNAADTEFGRRHGFGEIQSFEDYRAAVPPSAAADYTDWWRRIADGERNVLFAEPVHAFGLTSGTTGDPKLVPLNKALVRGLKRAIGYTVASHMAASGDFGLLRGYALGMSASGHVREQCGKPVGYITGIMGAERTYPFHNIGIPSREIVDLADWSEKYRLIEERYADFDVRMIFGIPGYTLGLLERLAERRPWRNIELVVTSGVPLDLHRARFEALCPGAALREMYLCTEAAIAFQPDASDPGMQPMVEDVVVEFVPEETWGGSNEPRVPLDGVEAGVRYVLLLTTPSGLYAYAPGDVVRFTSVAPPRMVVDGRLGNELNLAAEKLDGMLAERALREAGLRFAGFTVCPLEDRRGHEWVVEFDGPPPADAAARLDDAVRRLNTVYDHLRTGDTLFQRLHVTPVPPGTFQTALRSRAGHGKILPVYSHRRVRDELAGR